MQNYCNDSTERLFEAIAGIETPEECKAFFEDLCTIKEILDMAQRLDTAVMLYEGNSYQKIADKVGVSSATISRVSRALSYGSNGYKSAMGRLGITEKKNEDK